jgi:hypothetical protein
MGTDRGCDSFLFGGFRVLNAWIIADIVNSDRPLFERSGDGLDRTERTFVKVCAAQPVCGSKLQFIGFLINKLYAQVSFSSFS